GAVGSAGSGRLALAHNARTLPGVSWPSSVVRSIIEMAMSRAHCLAVVLMDRLASVAARASAPTRSTPGSPCRKPRSEASDQVTLCVTAVALMKVVTYPLLPHLAGYTPLRLPGMSVTLASMFACLDTDCSHRPPRRQCCETTARTPGTCGTLGSSSTHTGVPAGQARRATWSSADSSPPPVPTIHGWRRAPRWCNSRH